jgi:hypothetical protein
MTTKTAKTAKRTTATKRAKPIAKPAAKRGAKRTAKRAAKSVVVAPAKKARIPFAELRARKELAQRAIDDIRVLLEDADPVADPVDFAEREKKALALFEEVNALLPLGPPLSDAERARLEEELADKPDNATLRQILLEFEKIADDPAIPEDIRKTISKDVINDALRSLDEVELLRPIEQATKALVAAIEAPRRAPDPRLVAQRRELEKQAAKRRS